jgi:hypothetical protein
MNWTARLWLRLHQNLSYRTPKLPQFSSNSTKQFQCIHKLFCKTPETQTRTRTIEKTRKYVTKNSTRRSFLSINSRESARIQRDTKKKVPNRFRFFKHFFDNDLEEAPKRNPLSSLYPRNATRERRERAWYSKRNRNSKFKCARANLWSLRRFLLPLVYLSRLGEK